MYRINTKYVWLFYSLKKKERQNQIERNQQDEILGKYIYIIEAFISRCEPFSFEYEFQYQYKKGTILSYSFGSLLPIILSKFMNDVLNYL